MSRTGLQAGRLKVLAVAASIVAAAATLGAQRRMSASEAEVQYARANKFFAEARYDKAYKQYAKVFSSSDADVSVRALKGMIRSALRLSSFQTARQAAETLKARTDDADAATLSGDTLWAGGLFDEAEAAYTSARDRYPDAPRARFGVARSLMTRGRLDEALSEALAAATASPADPEILALVAELYERQFRFDEAARVYEEYEKLLPARVRNDSEAASIKIRLLRSFNGRTPVVMNDAGRPHTVPFSVRNKKILIEGILNGRKMEFVLDTGADRTAVTRNTAERAGIRAIVETMITGVGAPGIRRLAVGRLDTLSVGDLTVRDVPVSIRRDNMPGTLAWQNETFSPAALGLSVNVDYSRRQVTFGRRLTEEPADFRLPLRVYRLPFVRGLVNDKYPASFVVDTGGEMMSISRDVASQLAMAPRRRIPLRVWGIMGRDPDAFVLPFVNLNFEDIHYEKFAVAVLNLRAPSVLLGFQVGGILGHAFLSQYHVALDFARGELRLRKS